VRIEEIHLFSVILFVVFRANSLFIIVQLNKKIASKKTRLLTQSNGHDLTHRQGKVNLI
jgi:hypothetical protein